MDFQLLIVYVIGIVVAFILVKKLYKTFINKKNKNKCTGCPLCQDGACATPLLPRSRDAK